MWSDIEPMLLVPHLLLIKWMGITLVTQCDLTPDKVDTILVRSLKYLAVLIRQSALVIKVNRRIYSNACKRMLDLTFTVIVSV